MMAELTSRSIMPRSVTNKNLVLDISLEHLREPTFYDVLFPVELTTQQKLLLDTTVKVRPLDTTNYVFEIVTGVEQCRFAREQGAQTILAVIKEMTAEEARRHATDDLLRASALLKTRSTVQLLIAAIDNTEQGGEWSVERLTSLLGIKKSTYTHAWSCIKYVCDELCKVEPSTDEMGLAELVSLAIRRDFMSLFTDLYTGRMTVNKFYREHYRKSEVAQERSRQQREAKSKSQHEKQSITLEIAESESNLTALSPAISQPKQLIADGLLSFARAATLKHAMTGANTANDDQLLEQQLVELLDTHADLETEIRQVCKLVLNHLNAAIHNRNTQRRAARPAQTASQIENAQLSFELQEAASAPEDHTADLLGDDEARAA
jgi:hypothetical protein